MLKLPMAKLDNDDLMMIRNILKLTIGKVFERKEIAIKEAVSLLPNKRRVLYKNG